MKVRGPVNEPPDLNVNAPFDWSVREPLPPPSTSTAWRWSPSASVSFLRTPAAGTFRVTPVVAVYASSFATGAAFVTWIVTVTVFEGMSPLSW